MMYKRYRFFVFGLSFLMIIPSMHAYTPHPGVIVSWIGCLGTVLYRNQVITKLINKEDNEKWAEEQKNKKIQLYAMSEVEQQLYSEVIKRLKKAGMSGKLIEQCMELGATTEILEKLIRDFGATPNLIELIIKNGKTPLIFYKQLTGEITAQEAGFLGLLNHAHADRKTRFNSKLEYDEHRKKIWDQFKKDRPLLAVLLITAYATLIDFCVKPRIHTPSYGSSRDSDLRSSYYPQGNRNQYQARTSSNVISLEQSPIPDRSNNVYEHWDEDEGLPACSISYGALEENTTVYYCPWTHSIYAQDSYISWDKPEALCAYCRRPHANHILEAVYYKEQDKHVSVTSSSWLNFFRKVEKKYCIRIPVKNYSFKEGDIVFFCLFSQKAVKMTDNQIKSLSTCPGCKSNRSDWQNHLIRNFPITIIDSKPYLKIELKKEASK